MVPLMIVGLSVKFDVSVVFLSCFVQEREVGSRYCSFVFGVSEVLFWVLMSCCCDASLLWLGGPSTSFWVEFCFGVLFCSVLLSLSYSCAGSCFGFGCLKSLTTSSRLVRFVRWITLVTS